MGLGRANTDNNPKETLRLFSKELREKETKKWIKCLEN
jgi:hypothetical protein|tara:strand:- start:341 stop:454 length:114 start_codon:yes stop_codon:yes gene_type:complete